MTMGVQGSGKTYFAHQLASAWPAAHFSSDAIRRELYGSFEQYKRHGDYDDHHRHVFALLEQRVEMSLAAGQSVVRDYGQNSRRIRQAGYELASRFGARALTVWIKTPPDLAISRCSHRPDEADRFRFSPEYAKEIVAKSLVSLEPPGDDEPHIVVDGREGFDQQYEAFLEYLKRSLAPTDGFM